MFVQNDIEELNRKLWNDCISYRKKHKVANRQHPVNVIYQEESSFLKPIPRYRFDTSKTVIAKVDDFSTVRYEKNNYSVPAKYLRKDVTVKGYTNNIRILHEGLVVATYLRQYGFGHTEYRLEHYIDLLERKPPSVSNARPVKETLTKELLDWGNQLPTFNHYSDVIRQLGSNKSYEEFLLSLTRMELDCSRFEHITEAFVHELDSCDFVSKRQNIVMIGNPGTGKTHLSIAIGIKACMQGMNVKFYTAANLSNELIEAQEYKELIKIEKQLPQIDLLIIDELSYLTFNRHQSELLFKVIADRAERRSVIVSTNLKFSDWITMFENTTMVTALVDRLTFRSHVLSMNSDHSYRADYYNQGNEN